MQLCNCVIVKSCIPLNYALACPLDYDRVVLHVVTLFCFGLAAWHLEQIIEEDYSKYPSTSRSFTEYVKPTDFPAVTICHVSTSFYTRNTRESSTLSESELRGKIMRNVTV